MTNQQDDAGNIALYPAADLTVEHIGDQAGVTLSTLLGNAVSGYPTMEQS